ncbi:MotE family protein [Vannielia sp. SX4]|uniref:MotE family protein n=1 Tax=Vannielia sp. SX4 TaxID=3463852 RepID=UPI00405989DE
MARRKKSRSGLRRRLGRGLLTVLAGLLLSSAALRLTGGSGTAFAREVASRMSSDAGHEATPVVAGCEPEPEIAALLAALTEREAAVTARELAVSDEIVALERARAEVAREMAALKAAEAQLEETLALADGAAENDLAKLTRMYEVMKPKEAAALFAEMDPVFAAGFLGRMQPERAGAVLAGMEPKAAYTLSLILAGRNGAVPTE